MARRRSETPLKAEIIEYYGSLKENDHHDWCKAVARIAWGENPSTINIRNMNITTNEFGKGVTLTDEEADALVDLLIENDYGTTEVLEKAVEKRKHRIVILPPEPIEETVTITVT